MAGNRGVGWLACLMVSAFFMVSCCASSVAWAGSLAASPLLAPISRPAAGEVAPASVRAPADAATMAGAATKLPGGEEIEPYSTHPSEMRFHDVCPAPTEKRASCMAVGVPRPSALKSLSRSGLRSLGLARPSFEGSGELGGFSPADLRSAYKLPEEGGEGQLVAITIAYDDPDAESDLAKYREKYKLPACGAGCFEKVNQKGEAANYPASSEEFAEETSLDLDMVSATCPKCHILLVEAKNDIVENLLLAVEEAAKLGAKVISDSWDADESSEETLSDHYLDQPGVPVLFASGDQAHRSGPGVSWPSASPYVVSVGGTSLKKSLVTERGWSETAWSGTVSGCSEYEPKPSWQHDEGCSKRTTADAAAVADPSTPVSIYDSYKETNPGWALVGGTSVATPLTAGIEALSSKAFREAGPSAFYDAGQGGGLFDVTEGKTGYCDTYLCEAEVGYDGPTGWGTPDGPQVLPVALTEAAKVISNSEATLHGAVDPGGSETKYRIEYGTTTSYGTSVPSPEASVGFGSEYVEVSQTVKGIKSQTLYHYRTVATNSRGTFYGADRIFGTTPPSLTAAAAKEVGANNATLISTVNPEGMATKYYFEIGTSTSYGRLASLGAGDLAGSTNGSEVSAVVGGLTGSRFYHYRVVARNAAGTAYGEDHTLTTERTQWGAVPLAKQPEDPVEPHGASADVLTDVSCSSQNYCMAVGDYTAPLDQMNSQLWNGTRWIPHPMATTEEKGENLIYNVSCTSEDWCVAVGTTSTNTLERWKSLVEQWNGSKWTASTLEGPEGSSYRVLHGISCTSSQACVAVGYLYNSKEELEPIAYQWNGQGWSNMAMPRPGNSSLAYEPNVSCTSSSWCMVVGEDNSQAHPFAEEWAGGHWTVRDTNFGQSGETVALSDVSCAGPESCVVARKYESLERDVTAIERWNGTEWSQEGLPEPVGVEAFGVNGVSCVTASACTIVGRSHLWDGGYVPAAFAWAGGKWSVLSTADPTQEEEGSTLSQNGLEGVSCTSASTCVAVGSFLPQTGEEQGMGEVVRPPAPEATTEAASGVGPFEAGLSGTVNPNGTDTSYYFEYGLTSSYGKTTGRLDVGSGASPVKVGPAAARFSGEDSCWTTTRCESVGDYRYSSGGAWPMAEGWNGSEWVVQSVPSPAGSKEAILTSVSCWGTEECQAVGHYENASGVTETLAEHMDKAEEWEVQSTPNPEGAKSSHLTSVSCAGENSCTAVGSYENSSGTVVTLAESWNGKEWAVQTTPNPEGAKESVLEAASPCGASSGCMAVGRYKNSSGAIVTLAEYRNAATWEIVTTPNPEGTESSKLTGLSCDGDVLECTSTGSYENASGVWVTLAEHWVGKKWEIQVTPNPEGAKASSLYGVSCPNAGSECMSTGSYENASGVWVTLAEHWVGKKWEVQSIQNPEGAEETELGGVWCIEHLGVMQCTATGFYKNSSGVDVPLAAHWSSSESNWKVESTPYPASPLNGLRPEATYHFRIVATGLGGTTYGADRTFTTSARPEWGVKEGKWEVKEGGSWTTLEGGASRKVTVTQRGTQTITGTGLEITCESMEGSGWIKGEGEGVESERKYTGCKAVKPTGCGYISSVGASNGTIQLDAGLPTQLVSKEGVEYDEVKENATSEAIADLRLEQSEGNGKKCGLLTKESLVTGSFLGAIDSASQELEFTGLSGSNGFRLFGLTAKYKGNEKLEVEAG